MTTGGGAEAAMTSAPDDFPFRWVSHNGHWYLALPKPVSDAEWGLREPPEDDEDPDPQRYSGLSASDFTGERF